MEILRFCQLYKKYKEDEYLSLEEANLILCFNKEFCEKNMDIYHLSEKEKIDLIEIIKKTFFIL